MLGRVLAHYEGSIVLSPIAYAIFCFVLGVDSRFHSQIVAHFTRRSRKRWQRVSSGWRFVHQRHDEASWSVRLIDAEDLIPSGRMMRTDRNLRQAIQVSQLWR